MDGAKQRNNDTKNKTIQLKSEFNFKYNLSEVFFFIFLFLIRTQTFINVEQL